ncbi:MAG: hypothetical protein ACM3SX_03620 [Deltaproteobacteria bacterium]
MNSPRGAVAPLAAHDGGIESGRESTPGRVPAWGLPLVLLILVVASAGVAYVSS